MTNVIHKLLNEVQPTRDQLFRYAAQFERFCPRVFLISARVNVMNFQTFISCALALNLFREVFQILLRYVLLKFGVACHFINSYVEHIMFSSCSC